MSTQIIAGISKENDLSLNRLVNLALNSSPKVGVVNFNLLKTFLLELLKALNLQHYQPKFSDDSEASSLVQDAIQIESQHDNILNMLNNNNSDKNQLNTASNQSGISILTPDMKPLTLERFKILEDKLARFEQQMSALNSLPTNQQIIDKTKETKKASSTGPILEVWQYTQLSKRLESNEEGLTKLTSLLQDLIGEINELKEGQNKHTSDIKNLNNQYKDLLDRINSFDKLIKSLPSIDSLRNLEDELDALKKLLKDVNKYDEKFNHLANQIKTMETRIIQMVTHPDLELYVTWPSLENSLKGLRDALDTMNKKEPVIIEQRETQTTPTPNPIAPPREKTPPPQQETKQPTPPIEQPNLPNYIREKTISRLSSASHPSRDLQDILSKLGTLNERHENLRDIVDQLRLELSRKGSNTPTFQLPDDFAEKMNEIKKIKNTLEELRKNFDAETNKRLELEKILANLNSELENIRNALKECLKNTQLNRDDIISLKEALRILDETKADKDWVKSELERKADRRDLDNKVNKKSFDETTSDLSQNIDQCKQRTNILEDEWKRGTENIFKELENKLDKLELESLKEYIERQLKKLKKLNQNVNPVSVPAINPEDEAAGIRKQLLRFHCISCDRPIEMANQQMPLPSLPAEKGIRPIQTPRPYTTYELDQIRQFQKQQYLQEQGYDLFATVRQCGGPHTLTVPHKKLLKIPNPVSEEVPIPVPSSAATTHRNEVQLQGQDGHIYKGRIDARLSVEMKKPIKNSNSKGNNPNQVTSSFPNLRTVNDSKDGQDDQSFDKLPVFTN